jgi:pilus assembly protein Flp/PilA
VTGISVGLCLTAAAQCGCFRRTDRLSGQSLGEFVSNARAGRYGRTISDGDNAGVAFNKGRFEMLNILKFIRDENGATAIEYGLIAAGIAVVIIAAVQSVGVNLKGTFNSVASAI